MILLYSFVLVLCGGIRFLVERRATALGRRYSALARAVQSLLQTNAKAGGLNRVDPCQTARQHYELGLLVKKRDQVEARHFAWQATAENLGRWVDKLRGWKGQKLPYTLGVVDVWLLLTLIDHLGVADYLSARQLVQMVTALFTFE